MGIQIPALYIHAKNKSTYSTVLLGKMQFDGKWYPSVTYIDTITDAVYTRTQESFKNSFMLK